MPETSHAELNCQYKHKIMAFQSFHQRGNSKNLFEMPQGSFTHTRCFSTKPNGFQSIASNILMSGAIKNVQNTPAVFDVIVGGFVGTQSGSSPRDINIFEFINEKITQMPGTAKEQMAFKMGQRPVTISESDSDDFIVFEASDYEQDDETVIFEEDSSEDEDTDSEVHCCFSCECYSCDKPSPRIVKANQVWNSHYSEPLEPKVTQSDKKKVSFSSAKPTVRRIIVWDYAHRAARKSDWEMLARDSERFKNRIHQLASVINPVITQQHRDKIYNHRFIDVDIQKNSTAL